jgi:hypothetical protein
VLALSRQRCRRTSRRRAHEHERQVRVHVRLRGLYRGRCCGWRPPKLRPHHDAPFRNARRP